MPTSVAPCHRWGPVLGLPAAGAVALALALSGCSGGSAVSPGKAATALGAGLSNIGVVVDPGSLSCDDKGDLSSGASLSCSFTTNGMPEGLMAKVAKVSGSKVDFTISTQAKAVPAAVLASSVKSRVSSELGAAIDSATCDGGLQPTTGQSARCHIVSGGKSRTVTVAVTSTDGGVLHYEIKG